MAGNISQGYGIDPDTTAFLMLEAAALASGKSIVVRTPAGRTLEPGFNLAVSSKGAGFPRGAFAELISPVADIVRKACGQERERGRGATRNAFEAMLTARHEIRARLKKYEADLRTVKAKNARAEKYFEQTGGECQMAPGEFDAIRAAGFNFDEETSLERNIALDREALDSVEVDLQTLRLAAVPGILADEPDLDSLPVLSEDSFDRSTLALCFSGLPSIAPDEQEANCGNLSRADGHSHREARSQSDRLRQCRSLRAGAGQSGSPEFRHVFQLHLH